MSWLSMLGSKVWSAVAGSDQGDVKTENEKRRRDEAAAIAAAKLAAHNTEVNQLTQNSLSAIALRKRRGGYATMLTGSPMMGTSPGSTGKTMLSQ